MITMPLRIVTFMVQALHLRASRRLVLLRSVPQQLLHLIMITETSAIIIFMIISMVVRLQQVSS